MNVDTDHSVALQALGWKASKTERNKGKAKIMYKLLNKMGPKSLTNLFKYKGKKKSCHLRDIACIMRRIFPKSTDSETM